MKYIGSKARILKDILPILEKFNQRCDRFVDLFGGGANVASNINWNGKIIYNDYDELLVDLLKTAKNKPELIAELKTPTREEYAELKDGDYPNWLKGATLFFGSYNAKAYGGSYGAKTTTKEGKVREYYQEAKRNLLKQNLKQIDEMLNIDYTKFPVKKSDLVYCDIPYKNTIGYKTKFDHNAFWMSADVLSLRGIIIIVSEFEAPEDWVELTSVERLSQQNWNNNSEKVTEKLFIHKYNLGKWKEINETN